MDWFVRHLYKMYFMCLYLIDITLVVTFPDELFGLFSSQVEHIAFTCTACSAACSPGGAAHSGWREQLQGTLRARMEQVLTELLSSSTTQHLNRCRTVGDTSHSFTVLTGDTAPFMVRTVGDTAPFTVRTVEDTAPFTVRTVEDPTHSITVSLPDIPLSMQDVQQYMSCLIICITCLVNYHNSIYFTGSRKCPLFFHLPCEVNIHFLIHVIWLDTLVTPMFICVLIEKYFYGVWFFTVWGQGWCGIRGWRAETSLWLLRRGQEVWKGLLHLHSKYLVTSISTSMGFIDPWPSIATV